MKHILFASLLGISTLAFADVPMRAIRPPETRKQAQDLMDDASRDFAAAQSAHARLASASDRLAQLALQNTQQANALAERAAALVRAGGSRQQLLAATKQMQQVQMSFNLQYLQLQSQMQHENRSYTAVSNIMKTKHDTVKNSISNVR